MKIRKKEMIKKIRIKESDVGVLEGKGKEIIKKIRKKVKIRINEKSGVRWDKRKIEKIEIGGGVKVLGNDDVLKEKSGVKVNGMDVIEKNEKLV